MLLMCRQVLGRWQYCWINIWRTLCTVCHQVLGYPQNNILTFPIGSQFYSEKNFSENEMKEIESVLPLGWAFGDRYSVNQWVGPEKYC